MGEGKNGLPLLLFAAVHFVDAFGGHLLTLRLDERRLGGQAIPFAHLNLKFYSL